MAIPTTSQTTSDATFAASWDAIHHDWERASGPLIAWLTTPRCESCLDPSVILIRIQYPDESAHFYCLRCRPLTFIVEIAHAH